MLNVIMFLTTLSLHLQIRLIRRVVLEAELSYIHDVQYKLSDCAALLKMNAKRLFRPSSGKSETALLFSFKGNLR